jgi:hypothetical protein
MKKVVLFISTFLVIAVVGVYLSLGSIVKAAVQRGGSHALGVETTLGSADVNLFAGDVGLNELAVRNPPGFTEAFFLQMRGARVVVPPSSLTSDKVEVSLLSLDGFTLDLESKGFGNSNYGVLLENLEQLTGEGGGEGEPEPESGGKEEGKRFVITKILITDVSARVRYEAGGSSVADASVHIPEIVLDDLSSEGMTVSELTSLVVRTILSATVKNGGGILPAGVLDDLGGQLDDLTERGKEKLLERLEDELEDDEKALLDAAKGLFGKDK